MSTKFKKIGRRGIRNSVIARSFSYLKDKFYYFLYKNKKADIAILLLVLMTLVLVVTVSFVFYKNTSSLGLQIKDSRALDEIYVKENAINFYVNQIMDNSVSNMKDEKTAGKFIDNLKNEMKKYMEGEGYVVQELSQLDNQLDEKNVEIKDNKIFFNFTIKIEKNFDNKMIVSYLYNKKITKSLSVE